VRLSFSEVLSESFGFFFANIRLFFDLDGDVSPEQRATLVKLTERYCVVYQTLRQPPEIIVSRNAAGTGT